MKKTPLKRGTKPLRRRSKKTARLYRNERVPFVKALLAEKPVCDMCKVNRSVDVHEKILRSSLGAIVPGEKADAQGQVFFVLCREDHDYIHLNPKWARENGWLL